MGLISVGGYEPKHLSYSTVNGYRFCPKSFYFSKVARLEEKPGLASLAGNVVHTGTEWLDLADFYGVSIEDTITTELDKNSQRKAEYKKQQEEKGEGA